MLTRGIAWFESNPLAELVFKDITCFNLPKMATTRTHKEMLDVATLELSNTSVTLGSSLVLPPILQWVSSQISGVPRHLLKGTLKPEQLTPAVKLARLGTAFGFLVPFAAAFWGAAFFRNWMTLRREKTANFDQIIGLSKGAEAAASVSHSPAPHRSLEEEKAFQKGMAQKIMGLGTAVGAAALLGFGMMARGRLNGAARKPLSQLLERTYKTFHLGGDSGNQVRGFWPILIFWLTPAYGGWMHASRGENEFREQFIKAANSVLWFSVFNRFLVDPAFKNQFNTMAKSGSQDIPAYDKVISKYSGALRKRLIGVKNAKFLTGMAISIGMLAITPQLLNIWLTRRLHNKKLQAVSPQVDSATLPNAPRHLHTLQDTVAKHFSDPAGSQESKAVERAVAFRNFQPGSYTVLPLPEYQLQTARPVVEPSRPVYTPTYQVAEPMPAASPYSPLVSAGPVPMTYASWMSPGSGYASSPYTTPFFQAKQYPQGYQPEGLS
ncbi:MAG: hypothetical protein KC474_00175 [Cyanobacteria bacterium HKST-UBA04]|nr:hypothetical protein [Cyanobacteria bacterium HKST-UBA04]